jgi:hypothetical protein
METQKCGLDKRRKKVYKAAANKNSGALTGYLS